MYDIRNILATLSHSGKERPCSAQSAVQRTPTEGVVAEAEYELVKDAVPFEVMRVKTSMLIAAIEGLGGSYFDAGFLLVL